MNQPTETPRRLFRKAERGADEATPMIVISGVTIVIAAVVAVIVTIALILYVTV